MYNHAPDNYACPFCLLVQGIDSKQWVKLTDIVYQNDDVTAFMATRKWPNNTGHVLVIPNTHFENLYDLPMDVAAKIHDVAKAIALAMKVAYTCDGIMLRQHNEPDGGQHIWHYHLHVIPRYKNDQLHASQKQPFPINERAAYTLKIIAQLKD